MLLSAIIELTGGINLNTKNTLDITPEPVEVHRRLVEIARAERILYRLLRIAIEAKEERHMKDRIVALANEEIRVSKRRWALAELLANAHMGMRPNMASAIGRLTTVEATDVVAIVTERTDSAPASASDDLSNKLKQALVLLMAEKLPEVGKMETPAEVPRIHEETARPDPEPSRVRRLLARIAAMSKSVAETLSSAKAITDLFGLTK